jgi:hypothetical protein
MACPCPDDSSTSPTQTYVPSQSERADQLHQLTCPCSGTPAKPTDYATRDRKIRSLATGCCAYFLPTGITVTPGGSGMTGSIAYATLNGGVPVDKPLLIKLDLSGGAATGGGIAYQAKYYTPPTAPYTFTAIGGGTPPTITVSFTNVCPCPWAYTRTG